MTWRIWNTWKHSSLENYNETLKNTRIIRRKTNVAIILKPDKMLNFDQRESINFNGRSRAALYFEWKIT